MKVLLVSDFYAPYVGGVEQHVRSLAHGLAEHGHEVSVATTATSRAPEGADRDGAVVVHRIPTLSARIGRLHADAERPWAPPIPDPLAARALRRIIRDERPDVVHTHDWLGRSAAPWCGRRGPALVVTQHYYTRSCARKDLWRDGAPCTGPALVRCIACSVDTYGPAGVGVALGTRAGAALADRRAAAIVAVSEATARGNHTTRPYTVIPNLLAPAAAAPGGEVPDDLGDEPFLLFVGDLRETKGFPVLLDAYQRLESPPRLVVVGERDVSSRYVLPPGVVHLGTLENGVVQALFRRCLFGIVPSVWSEPFGIVALEAMAAGRPVVASDVGGLAEVVDHRRTGLLVPPGDPVALAEAIDELLGDATLVAALGEAARSAVRRYTPERVVRAVELLYLDQLDDAARVTPAVRRRDGASNLRTSIVVTNHDYGRYLRQAVDSALTQPGDPEVVVVDDNSSDDSAEILAGYGDRITVVSLDPPPPGSDGAGRGQGAGFNAGLRATSGDIVVYLDADDRLAPGMTARLAEVFDQVPEASRVHFPLRRIGDDGEPIGNTVPLDPDAMPHGNLRSRVLSHPDDLAWQPTSGNAYRRRALEYVLPMPESPYEGSADYYLNAMTAVVGRVERLGDVLGDYRIHGTNADARSDFDLDRTQLILKRSTATHEHLGRLVERLGLPHRRGTIGSVSFHAHRVVSLRLSPGSHPLRGDRVADAVVDGIRGAATRTDLPWRRRMLAGGLVLAVAVAPRRLVPALSQRYLAGATDDPTARRVRHAPTTPGVRR